MKTTLRTLIIILLALCLAGSPDTGLVARRVQAQGSNRAVVYINYGDHAETRCVTFAEFELPGIELLRRAGLDVIGEPYPGIGEAVCRIQDVGCSFPAEHCWCECMGSPCLFWNYWYWEGGSWRYSGMGASSRMVRNGGIDAWIWGDGQTEPPAIDFDSVCVASTPTHTPPPTETPEPTWTPEPTPTPEPPEPTEIPWDPYPEQSPEPPEPTSAPSDGYPDEYPTDEPTWTLLPTATRTGTPGPSPRPTRTSTPGRRATQAPAGTALPTHTLLDSLQQIVVSATPETALADASESSQPHTQAEAEALAMVVAPAGETPDAQAAAAVAALISTSVAQGAATPEAAATSRAPRRSYGVFVALAAAMLALVGYAAAVQRQRQQNRDRRPTP
ncbi:MAG: hypothetical protein GX557_04765 [Chloroflexi bacterium]|nr:hypothetical protein [Chloroflexota bacterium]